MKMVTIKFRPTESVTTLTSLSTSCKTLDFSFKGDYLVITADDFRLQYEVSSLDSIKTEDL